MNDIIKKAVELADNFELDSINAYYWHDPSNGEGFDGIATDSDDPSQWFLDALAAQLVRQVDGSDAWFECNDNKQVRIGNDDGLDHWEGGPDRTMNTIKAIVDSGVLE